MVNYFPLRANNIYNNQMNIPQIDWNTGFQQQQVNPFEGVDFGGNLPVDVTTESGGMGEFDVASRMRQLYNPSNEASTRYNTLINEYPEYERPSMLRTIGAALSAFGPGGHQTGQQVMNFHNDRRLADWKNQVTQAEKAADNERAENINSRTLAHQQVSQELRERSDSMKHERELANTKIRQQLADIKTLKANNPKLEMKFPEGGNILIFNPETGEIKTTDVPTGTLSDMDKMVLQQKNAIARIEATGDQSRQTEEIRQAGRETIQDVRGWKVGTIPDPNDPTKQIGVQYNEATGEVKPIEFNGKPIEGGIFRPGITQSKKEDANLEAIQNKTRETLAALDEILDDKGKIRDTMRGAIGASRMFGLQYLPATETRAADATIKRLKSMLIVDLVGEMKAQSRTGATGFGQLNLRELAVLENAASKLDPALDEATFEAELKRIREKLNKVLQPKDGLNPIRTDKPNRRPTAREMIDFYSKQGGGQ